MRLLFTLGFMLSFCLILGQSGYPSKKEVTKVIKLAISQKITKNNIACDYGQCGEWITANTDSIFYKSDTIKFYNSSNIAFRDTTFCHYIAWNFMKHHYFSDGQAQICEEPPRGIVTKRQFPYKYNIISKDNITYILINESPTFSSSYKVIGLTKTTQENLGNQSYCLTLVKQKKR